MRSRPSLSIRISPSTPRAGEQLSFELTLHSKSNTPVDEVTVRLIGVETLEVGEGGRTHTHFEILERFEGFVLGTDERKTLAGSLLLPDEVLPEFHSRSARLEHLLEVRVDIPWWPDAVVVWKVPIGPAPKTRQKRPGLFSNRPEGPSGNELMLEVALEECFVLPGETVRGVVAVGNTGHHRVDGLKAALICNVEDCERTTVLDNLSIGFPTVVSEWPPRNDGSYPFELFVPADAPPTVLGSLSQQVWRVEVRAHRRMANDVVIAPQLIVLQTASGQAPAPAPARDERTEPHLAPPVGHERRALVWKEVAARSGLEATDDERMTGMVGPVRVAVQLELRDGALWSTAQLDWADVGFDLTLAEKRFRDRFKGGLPLGDDIFDERFVCRARDPRQAGALLGPAVRPALYRFDRVLLDDDGCALASIAGGSYRLESLERFVRDALNVARQVAANLPSLPPPLGLEGCLEAWRAAAAEWNGTFCAGDCSIRGARYRGFDVELVTRFEGAAPKATVARIVLAKAASIDPLPPDAQRVLDSISVEVPSVRVAGNALEAELPSPLEAPKRAELTWRTLERLVRALSPAAPT